MNVGRLHVFCIRSTIDFKDITSNCNPYQSVTTIERAYNSEALGEYAW